MRSQATPGGFSEATDCKPVLLKLDATLFRRPAEMGEIRVVSHSGVELRCLDAAALTRDNLFDVGFDTLVDKLARLPRADVEPDGFFVLTGNEEGLEWRLNGQIHELNERIWRVDLRGESTISVLDELLVLLGWPAIHVAYQLAWIGLTLGEDDFRRLVARRAC